MKRIVVYLSIGQTIKIKLSYRKVCYYEISRKEHHTLSDYGETQAINKGQQLSYSPQTVRVFTQKRIALDLSDADYEADDILAYLGLRATYSRSFCTAYYKL